MRRSKTLNETSRPPFDARCPLTFLQHDLLIASIPLLTPPQRCGRLHGEGHAHASTGNEGGNGSQQ